MAAASRWTAGLVAVLLTLGPGGPRAQDESGYERARAGMVAAVREQTARTAPVTGRSELAGPVLDALAAVPRHRFVPDPIRRLAYRNRPLPVGYGQTISSPFLVALMLDVAEVEAGDRVLVVGIGGGYMAAVAAELDAHVRGVDLQQPVARAAADNLVDAGYPDVPLRVGDSYYGWPEHGPYDAILLRHAVGHVPEPLARQLAPGGQLVAPIGPSEGGQTLTRLAHDRDSPRRTVEEILPVRFTALPGGSRL